MTINAGLFTSDSETWETPPDLFAVLDREFGFTLDVCATPATAKCDRFYTPRDDALAQPWAGMCWMNPPYGRKIGQWVAKAWHESIEHGSTVVCLLPARTDTAWWFANCRHGAVRFLRGRLVFWEDGQPGENGAPFPSAVVVFGRDCPAATSYWDWREEIRR